MALSFVFHSSSTYPRSPLVVSFPQYVGDKASELASGTSKEANKEVAKDSDASLGTRASAAKVSLALTLVFSKPTRKLTDGVIFIIILGRS